MDSSIIVHGLDHTIYFFSQHAPQKQLFFRVDIPAMALFSFQYLTFYSLSELAEVTGCPLR